MHLRAILPRDREPLAALLSRTENFSPGEVSVALELIDESIRVPQGGDYACIVAVEEATGGERLLGYLCYGPTPMTTGTYDLYWVAVDRAYRGQSIGRKLTEAFEQMMSDRKARIIRIETSSMESYGGTLEFYLHRGYTIIGRIPDFYKPNDDLIVLTKRL